MKKAILSLAALAMVAVGTVSCGSDDNTPGPQPEPGMSENFIQVDDSQSEVTYTIYAVHTDGGGNNAPIKEYNLDGTIYAAFEVISHDGAALTSIGGTDNTYVTLLTKVNVDKPVGSDERVLFPYEVEGTTFLGGFETTMNGTDYKFATGATFDLVDYHYATSTTDSDRIEYNLEGVDKVDGTIKLRTNVKGEMSGLYGMNVSGAKGLDFDRKNAQLTLRKK